MIMWTRSHRIVPALWWVGLLLIAITTRSAWPSPAEQLWEQTRTAEHYLYQGVVVGPGRDAVIVCEPPPGVTEEQIADVLGAISHSAREHTIGYDGWTRDVLLNLGAPVAEDELAERLAQLSLLLYGTTIGFEPRQLSPGEVWSPRELDLDVRIAAPDLIRWLIDEKAPLKDVEDGRSTVTTSQLLNDARPGVYATTPGTGLVLWAMPKNAVLRAGDTPSIRRWVALSDLVLGAIEGPNGVVIVGRARQHDEIALPPLRTEEILRLAAARTSELAQSYERNHVLAGRWTVGEYHDWAPIYLSPELIDTEYGTLLNITDQMLKSWSQAGHTRYFGFDMPTPDRLPFGDMTASELMGGSSLTFNWNTVGVGHEVTTRGVRCFAVGRTGSLPVTYIPEGMAEGDLTPDLSAKVSECETAAYDYFSTLGEPQLARVVQYAALYQIFQAFGITSDAAVLRELPSEGFDVLYHAIGNAINKIRTATDDQLDQWTRDFGKRQSDYFAGAIPEEEREDLAGAMELGSYFGAMQLRAALAEFSALEGRRLARMLANPQDITDIRKPLEEAIAQHAAARPIDDESAWLASLPAEQREALRLWATAQILQDDGGGLSGFVAFLADNGKVQEEYAKAFQAARTDHAWIRTPSLVRSEDTTDSGWVGGHNLDSTIGHIVEDATVAQGMPRVVEDVGTGRMVCLVHPADLENVCLLEREFALARVRKSEVKFAEWIGRLDPNLPKDPASKLKLAGTGGGNRKPPGSSHVAGTHPDPWAGESPGSSGLSHGTSRAFRAPDESRALEVNGMRVWFTTGTSLGESLAHRGLRTGDRVVLNVSEGVLTPIERRALQAVWRARAPEGAELVVVVVKPAGDGRSEAAIRALTNEMLARNYGGVGVTLERTYETKVYGQSMRIVHELRLDAPEGVAGLTARSTDTVHELAGTLSRMFMTTPDLPAGRIKAWLHAIPECADIEFELHLQDKDQLQDIWISDKSGALESDRDVRTS